MKNEYEPNRERIDGEYGKIAKVRYLYGVLQHLSNVLFIEKVQAVNNHLFACDRGIQIQL